jgi:hypothetical protein
MPIPRVMGKSIQIMSIPTIKSIPTSVQAMEHIADTISEQRVALRARWSDGTLNIGEFEAATKVLNDVVVAHIRWYKKHCPEFDELSFIGCCADPAAIGIIQET